MTPRVFLDTVGLLALRDKTDQWHERAALAYAQADAETPDYYTTTYVLLECANAAARRPFRMAPERLRERLEGTRFLVRPTEADWRAAWDAYRRSDGAGAGIVDQFSFIAMRRLGIAQAFTNDAHFRAAGFEPLF